ncbi:uncharacterized protein LOC135947001 [Cloeon dipterum]|uniref:uncharacterized protein LOC135947001 n=1 Tax=Cloeon dipterum TaxID=197152 RepID=UPI00321FC873
MQPCYNFFAVCVLAAFVASASTSNSADESKNATKTTTLKPETGVTENFEEPGEKEHPATSAANSTHVDLLAYVPTLSVEVQKDGIDVHIRRPQIRREWWNGLNVCKEKKVSKGTNNKEKAEGSSASVSTFAIGNSDGMQSGIATQCTNDGETYSCTITRIENDEEHTETTTYKCCDGYKHSDNPRFDGRCVRDLKGR